MFKFDRLNVGDYFTIGNLDNSGSHNPCNTNIYVKVEENGGYNAIGIYGEVRGKHYLFDKNKTDFRGLSLSFIINACWIL